eukprot:CAMPEP_0194289572 /NCGR_PEP_ID=MMETSP0169-20130528/39328_1 /TAXON_ID=218684 /ORGANISM="Corethron pennatum, Strain L29A3" /LENGTH=367 /DNA_ID=CAMNT_0039036887 /DNA_START=67 /DNA_END=1170 /DNA_ORIENTATION=-
MVLPPRVRNIPVLMISCVSAAPPCVPGIGPAFCSPGLSHSFHRRRAPNLRLASTSHFDDIRPDRRGFLFSFAAAASVPVSVSAEDGSVITAPEPVITAPVDVTVGEVYIEDAELRKLFGEATVKESQGNVMAAQRLYLKVTKLVPKFVFGWSNLANTQVVSGDFEKAEASYTTAINLCRSNLASIPEDSFGKRKCDGMYLIMLNRGALRLNDGRTDVSEALSDLRAAERLRGRPDFVILQNLARAEEISGLYGAADRNYATAISMTSNEVVPFWLRAGMVKMELGDQIGAFDLVRRVEVKFPEAPEVNAAIAALLAAKGDMDGAKRKWQGMYPAQQELFKTDEYLTKKMSWPPVMRKNLALVSGAER